VPELLESSDLIVLSSHWEGLSLSSIEGMASGRPFIASDVEGLREIVGGAGVLFPHGDSKTLAQKIQWLCENPDEYRAVARRCQARAQQYDISIMAQKYSDLYKSLVK
jgi:glycosyltransferase involved in cell wall biosynthesis